MGKGEIGASGETVQTMWYGFRPGKAVVPKPVDNRTVVFIVFFEAGLRFPCNVLLPEILRLFQTVVTPAGTKKTMFGSMNFNVRPEHSDLWPVNAAMSKWDRHWMARWFYHTIPFEAGSESAKALRCRRRAIAPNRKPKIAVDGAMEERFALLRKVCSRISCRDLVEEFCMLLIFPSPIRGKSRLTKMKRSTADAKARRMIGDVSVIEYSQLLTRQAAGRVDRVYDGELPPRANPHKADDDTGPSRKRTHGQVRLAPRKQRVHASFNSDADDEDDVEERDGEEEREEEEGADAAAGKAADEAGAKALVAFSAGKVAKGCPVKKAAKKKGLVDVARVFSDDESSDKSPTSPTGRSLDLSTAPVLPIDASGAGGSAAARASASTDRVVKAAARVFGSPLRQPIVSLLVKPKGKGAAVETSAPEYSLAAPHFAPGDFETRAELIPFVEGVSNLVSPVGTLSLFTELNEFDEGIHLRAKDDEIGRMSLEMEALANTLKEAELEKGREARAEVDRLMAELKKEKAHSAVLTDYYNLTEPKIEALDLEVSKAEASAAEESQRFSREMAKATESAKTVCQMLRLALFDMGVRVRGVPAEDASAFDFSEWTQQAAGVVSDCATAYGDCCARVSAAFTMGLLHQFGCEHVAEFPNYAKGEWETRAKVRMRRLDGVEAMPRITQRRKDPVLDLCLMRYGPSHFDSSLPTATEFAFFLRTSASTLTPSRSSSDTSRPSSPQENITLGELAPSYVGVIASSP
uniref:Uncharacterized protein n=1 Tax=Oryza sativa subsp. japonica TaxID=39947 RepID=Q8S6B6_ORYSJ|nr:hypothetical protein [Oryza sativa Japonica Group]